MRARERFWFGVLDVAWQVYSRAPRAWSWRVYLWAVEHASDAHWRAETGGDGPT